MASHKNTQPPNNHNFGFAGDDDDNNNSSGGESSSGGSHKLLTSARLQRHSNAHANTGTISSHHNPLLDGAFPGVFPYNAPNGTNGSSDNGSYNIAGLGFAFDVDEVNNGYGSQGSNGSQGGGGPTTAHMMTTTHHSNNNNNNNNNNHGAATANHNNPLHGMKVPATARNGNTVLNIHRTAGTAAQSTLAAAQSTSASFPPPGNHRTSSSIRSAAKGLMTVNTNANNNTLASATVSVSTGSNSNSATNSVTGVVPTIPSAAAAMLHQAQLSISMSSSTLAAAAGNSNTTAHTNTSTNTSTTLPQSVSSVSTSSTTTARSTGSHAGTKRRASNISTADDGAEQAVPATIASNDAAANIPRIRIMTAKTPPNTMSSSGLGMMSFNNNNNNSSAMSAAGASDASLASSTTSSKHAYKQHCSNNNNGGKKILDDSKREERNMREKERSLRISQQINELRELLSTGGVVVPKGTKSSVLTEAANYIRVLQQHQYRSEMDRYQLVQQMQRIGAGALGGSAASAIRHVASQNGVWSLGNFGGLPPRSALQNVNNANVNLVGGLQQSQAQAQAQASSSPTAAAPANANTSTAAVAAAADPRAVTSVEEGDYRKVFNSCAVGMAIASMGGAFIDCNEIFSQLSQYTKQELCAMTVFNLTSRDDLQNAFDVISSMISPPSANNVNAHTQPPVQHCVLKGAMKARDDLGLSVTIIRSEEGVAKCFCVTLIHNQATASASFSALQQKQQQQKQKQQVQNNTYMPPPSASNVTVKQGKPQGSGPYFTTG